MSSAAGDPDAALHGGLVTEPSAYPTVTVLHLSDLHSPGSDGDTARSLIYRRQLECLADICDPSSAINEDGDWSPDLIAISGDIAQSGAQSEYEAARRFLQQLLKEVALGPHCVVICPGNHDREISEDAEALYPQDSAEADDWLTAAYLRDSSMDPLLIEPFARYVEFCEDSKVLRPEGIDGLEHLTGRCRTQVSGIEVEFLVTNSAWFASRRKNPGSHDLGNMWLGLPLLEGLGLEIEAERHPPSTAETLRIALCHHPREWLHPAEYLPYGHERLTPLSALGETCHLILTGHTHGPLSAPTRLENAAQMFASGASYDHEKFQNNFSLLQVNMQDRSVARRGFEWQPNLRKWEERNAWQGIYHIGVERTPSPAFVGDVDLQGTWESVFWQERQSSIRKRYDEVVFENGSSRDLYCAQTRSPRQDLSLQGRVRDGYFSGHWSDERKRKHGTFHLKLCDEGFGLAGRWLGFDKSAEVNVGFWRFWRRDGG